MAEVSYEQLKKVRNMLIGITARIQYIYIWLNDECVLVVLNVYIFLIFGSESIFAIRLEANVKYWS